jgi:hypothetical protein
MEPIRRRVHRSSSNGTAVSTTTLGRNRRIGSGDGACSHRITPSSTRLGFDVHGEGRTVQAIANGHNRNGAQRSLTWAVVSRTRFEPHLA